MWVGGYAGQAFCVVPCPAGMNTWWAAEACSPTLGIKLLGVLLAPAPPERPGAVLDCFCLAWSAPIAPPAP
jgi:hypothetical protein